jgi:hypothetical protein
MMRSRLATLLAIIVLASGANIPNAQAQVFLSSCLSGSGSGTLSGDTVVITVNLTITCTVLDPKSPDGYASFGKIFFGTPVYEIVGDTFFINNRTGYCSGTGSELTPLQNFNSFGTVTCRIPSSLTSRYGATSSTLEVWVDIGNAVFITVSHPAIPSPSGGASSGSTIVVPPPVAAPSCLKAPATPTLSYEWTTQGVAFTAKPATTGDLAQSMHWSYTLYDKAKDAWDTWSSWATIQPAGTFTYQAKVDPNKTRIAFGVYSTNACGSSDQAREIDTHVGIPLVAAIQDSLSLLVQGQITHFVVDKVAIENLVQSSSGLYISATSLTTSVCNVDGGNIVNFDGAGTCTISFTSLGKDNVKSASAITLNIAVSKSNRIYSDWAPGTVHVNESESLNLPQIDPPAPMLVTVLTLDICSVNGETLAGRAVGVCKLTLEVAETFQYLGFSKNLDIPVTKSPQTIIAAEDSVMFPLTSHKVALDVTSDSSVPIQSKSLTPKICTSVGRTAILLAAGKCSISFFEPETKEYAASNKVLVNIDISGSQKILCVKGSTLKSIVGANPKCPVGYRRK